MTDKHTQNVILSIGSLSITLEDFAFQDWGYLRGVISDQGIKTEYTAFGSGKVSKRIFTPRHKFDFNLNLSEADVEYIDRMRLEQIYLYDNGQNGEILVYDNFWKFQERGPRSRELSSGVVSTFGDYSYYFAVFSMNIEVWPEFIFGDESVLGTDGTTSYYNLKFSGLEARKVPI